MGLCVRFGSARCLLFAAAVSSDSFLHSSSLSTSLLAGILQIRSLLPTSNFQLYINRFPLNVLALDLVRMCVSSYFRFRPATDIASLSSAHVLLANVLNRVVTVHHSESSSCISLCRPASSPSLLSLLPRPLLLPHAADSVCFPRVVSASLLHYSYSPPCCSSSARSISSTSGCTGMR